MRTKPFLSLFLALGLLLVGCSNNDTPEGASSGATTTAAATGSSSSPDAGGATVTVADDAQLGEYLVDAGGRTLYLFERDQGSTTACTGACADNWPPLIADGPVTGGGSVDPAELSTAEGISPDQVTYHGHLLYYFAGDTAPGDTNGTAVPSWYAVAPSGDAIEPG